MNGNGLRRSGLALAVVVGVAAWGVPAQHPASGDEEVARKRVNLTPSYHPGDQFRVIRDFKQRTVTGEASRRGGVGPRPNFRGGLIDPDQYDAMIHVEALVTVEETSPAGEPEVWKAKLEMFRYDLPDPLQSSEYRDRRREQKAKNLPENAHPLEGEIVKVDESGKKTKVYRQTEKGEDYGITNRYPEVLPLMQELVEPDWIPVESIPIGGQWEMNADHIFRFSRVLMRTPLRGTIQCSLTGIANDVATIPFRSKLKNSYAKIDMELSVSGTIVFDLGHRRPASTSFSGEVQISSPGSSLRGIGTIDGGVVVQGISPAASEPGATPASAPKK